MNEALAWFQAHPLEASLGLYVLLGLLSAFFKPRTEEEYGKMAPWLAGFLKAFSALGLDPVKLVEALAMILKVAPPPRHDIKQDFADQDQDPDRVAEDPAQTAVRPSFRMPAEAVSSEPPKE